MSIISVRRGSNGPRSVVIGSNANDNIVEEYEEEPALGMG